MKKQRARNVKVACRRARSPVSWVTGPKTTYLSSRSLVGSLQKGSAWEPPLGFASWRRQRCAAAAPERGWPPPAGWLQVLPTTLCKLYLAHLNSFARGEPAWLRASKTVLCPKRDQPRDAVISTTLGFWKRMEMKCLLGCIDTRLHLPRLGAS